MAIELFCTVLLISYMGGEPVCVFKEHSVEQVIVTLALISKQAGEFWIVLYRHTKAIKTPTLPVLLI